MARIHSVTTATRKLTETQRRRTCGLGEFRRTDEQTMSGRADDLGARQQRPEETEEHCARCCGNVGNRTVVARAANARKIEKYTIYNVPGDGRKKKKARRRGMSAVGHAQAAAVKKLRCRPVEYYCWRGGSSSVVVVVQLWCKRRDPFRRRCVCVCAALKFGRLRACSIFYAGGSAA